MRKRWIKPLAVMGLVAAALLSSGAADPVASDTGVIVVQINADATAAANTASIQAALDLAVKRATGEVFLHGTGDGAVTVAKGTSALAGTLNTALVIGSHTKLRLSPTTRLTLAAGANCFLLRNSDPTNGNSDIEVTGGAFDGNSSSQTLAGSSVGWLMLWTRVDDLHLHDFKYYTQSVNGTTPRGWTWNACNRLHIHDIWFQGGGFQGNGPSKDIRIENIVGTGTTDNVLAVAVSEGGYYTDGTHGGTQNSVTFGSALTYGPCENIIIRNIRGDTSGNPVRIFGDDGSGYGSSGWYMRHVVIDGVHGVSVAGGGVSIVNDTTYLSGPSAKFSDILVRNSDVQLPGDGAPQVGIQASDVVDVTCENITLPSGSSNSKLIEVGNVTTIKELNLRNIHRHSTGITEQWGGIGQIYVSGTINNMTVDHLLLTHSGTLSAGAAGIEMLSTGYIKRLNIQDSTIDNGTDSSLALVSGAGGGVGRIDVINANNCHQSGGYSMFDISMNAGTANLNNITFTPPADSGYDILRVHDGGKLPYLNANNIYYHDGNYAFRVLSDAGSGAFNWQVTNFTVKNAWALVWTEKAMTFRATSGLLDGISAAHSENFIGYSNAAVVSTLNAINVAVVNSGSRTTHAATGTITLSATP